MSEVTRNTVGVRLTNLNWGYQIVHENRVLAAIHDTQGGPNRTEQCSKQAQKRYEQLSRVYTRLYRQGKPTEHMLNALEAVIKRDRKKPRYWVSLQALARRGIIKRVNVNDYSYSGWNIVDD